MQYLRGALADLTGEIRAKASARARASSVRRPGGRADPAGRRALRRRGRGPGRDHPDGDRQPGRLRPAAQRHGAHRRPVRLEPPGGAGRPAGRRSAQDLVVENDVDAAALAERAHGHGREFGSFAFVWIGTGIGMGLVLDGRLHRGAHGVAGEIAFMPISEGLGTDAGMPGRRGTLEAAARRRP